MSKKNTQFEFDDLRDPVTEPERRYSDWWLAQYPGPAVPAWQRTSVTDPIEVDWVPAEVVNLPGKLGMSIAPGKQHPKGYSGSHKRALNADLDRLQNKYKVHVVVSLMEHDEMVDYAIGDLRERVQTRGMESLWLPIRDLSIPVSMRQHATTVERICQALQEGKHVLVHCRGGHGRTGVVVASVLVNLGYTHTDAIKLTRAARKGTLHNVGQEDFVALYHQWLNEDD